MPDSPTGTPEGKPEAKAEKRFKCDACAAELSYDAATQKLKCSFCGAVKDVPAEFGEVKEHDLFAGLAALPRGLGAEKTRTSGCQECGAQVVFAENVTATKCTFCGSSRILEQSENQNTLRPESLLPFSIDRKQANQHFATWLGKLWFRPNDLKQLARVEEVAGVYVPFWTFDADVASRWTAEAGYYYYTDEDYTVQENGQSVQKTRRVQHTRWERAWGQRNDHYDDVLVCASKGLPPELAKKLHTFDTQQLVPYSPGFLAGWRAEEYAIDLQNGFGGAQEVMQSAQEKLCSGDVPGDTQRSLRVTNTFSSVTFKHVLLPVWIAAYRYRNDVYRFLVNGQTGEVVGKAPWSWAKLALLVLAISAVLVALYFLLGNRPPQH
jgi:DNA-directed RNA polymerase subunit RPC12/RpoP